MKSRVLSLIEIEGVELDIYIIQMPGDGELDATNIYNLSDSIKNVFVFKGKNSFSYVFSKYPICNKRRYTRECVDELKNHKYDYFIYEGEQIAIYRLKNVVNSKNHIIYMHDIESKYRREIAKAQTGFAMRIMQNSEARRFEYIENRIDAFFDEVWFISKEEFDGFKHKLSCGKGMYLPMPAMDIGRFVKQKTDGTILYIGDLRLKNNLLSLEWFAKEVFALIKKQLPDIVMNVVGNINDFDKQKIIKDGINILGYVDDIELMYQNSSCFVCPVIYGAGVKVKTIDALSKGIIVVTTKKGAEGTELKNGEHLFVIDNPQEMANKIVDICKNIDKYENIKKAGYDFVKKNHSIEHQAELIESTFYKLSRRSD